MVKRRNGEMVKDAAPAESRVDDRGCFLLIVDDLRAAVGRKGGIHIQPPGRSELSAGVAGGSEAREVSPGERDGGGTKGGVLRTEHGGERRLKEDGGSGEREEPWIRGCEGISQSWSDGRVLI